MKDIVRKEIYCDKLKGEVICSHVVEFIHSSNRGIIAVHKKDFKCNGLHLCENFDCDKIKNKDELIYK